jgi:hypothetical protein
MKKKNLAGVQSNWIIAYTIVPYISDCTRTYGHSTVTCKSKRLKGGRKHMISEQIVKELGGINAEPRGWI